MRQIKFRAWSPRKQKFIDYDYQLGIEYDETDYENCIFQQFTGFKDINNKEIWEGDHLSWAPTYPVHYVEFRSGCFWIGNQPLYMQYHGYEVIGNIFEGNNK